MSKTKSDEVNAAAAEERKKREADEAAAAEAAKKTSDEALTELERAAALQASMQPPPLVAPDAEAPADGSAQLVRAVHGYIQHPFNLKEHTTDAMKRVTWDSWYTTQWRAGKITLDDGEE